MLTDMQMGGAWFSHDVSRREPDFPQPTHAFPCERKWRQPEQGGGIAAEDITISRWTCAQPAARREEATTPPDRYFIAIALKTTRLKLTRGNQSIFDGIMPARHAVCRRTLEAAQRAVRCALRFPALPHLRLLLTDPSSPERTLQPPKACNDLVLLRDPFAEQLAKALTEHGNSTDQEFVRCIGQTLALHVARRELPRTKVNALPKWRLRRVEEYVGTHFDHCISLSDLARVAGLSRMHFAAQFRAATGYRPREYLLHQRIEHAKSLLSNSKTSLAEVALAVGFCTQAHFSTVFKRITGDTPARWRCARRSELSLAATFGCDPAPVRNNSSRVPPQGNGVNHAKSRNFLGS